MIATQPKTKPYSTSYVPHTVPHVDEHDDTLMNKEEFFAEIDRSLQQAKEGKVLYMLPGETLDEFLIRTQECIE
ncbi:MAG: hypothetical protein LBL94_01525 [Prevotellaceae bacterium]|jgi:aminopeptidase-like protein|nr:hypothetical protein [Prevotellaceae bacterium]